MIDTHCHIHDDDFPLDADEALKSARSSGVTGVICVGTSAKYSQQAVTFAQNRQNVWASVGLHPHDAKQGAADMDAIAALAESDGVIAIGECGLDYYYDNSPRDEQQAVLRRHLEIAQACSLPLIFHIRGKQADSSDAYADFWHIYDDYSLPGVVHSFSAHETQLSQILERDLFVGVNGIATFVKPGPQLEAYAKIPLEKLLLETDAPLLTPAPYRGRINEPKHITTIISFLSTVRTETIAEIGTQSSLNAEQLFGIQISLPQTD